MGSFSLDDADEAEAPASPPPPESPPESQEVSGADAEALGLTAPSQPAANEVTGADAEALGLKAPAPLAPAPRVPTAPAPGAAGAPAPSPPSPEEAAQALQPLYDTGKQAALADNFTAWKACARDTTPAHQLEVMQYMAKTGLPAETVEKTLPTLRKTVQQAELLQALVRTPGLARLLQDANAAPLAKDDVKPLTGVEWALTGRWEYNATTGATTGTAPAWARALESGRREQEYVALTNKAAINTASPDDYARLSELALERDADGNFGAEHWWSQAYTGLFKNLPYLTGYVAASGVGSFVGAAVGGATGAEAGAIGGGTVGLAAGGVGAAPGAVAGGGVGGAVGGAGGAVVGQRVADFAYNFYQNFGPQYWALKALKTSEGAPLLDDDSARLLAAGASGFSSALMAGVTGKILKRLAPGMEKVAGKLGTDMLSKALAQPTVARTLLVAPLKFGARVAEGGLLMATVAATNQASEELARGMEGEGVDLSRITSASAQAFVQGMVDMAFFTAHGAGREFLADVSHARTTPAGAMRLGLAVDAAQQSQLLKRSPEQFENFVRLAQRGKNAHVLIDKEAWDRFAQTMGTAPDVLAAKVVGDGGAAYREADTTGGSLHIPTERYLSSDVTREAHAGNLEYDVRDNPDALSVNQARARMETRARAEAEVPREKLGEDYVYEDVRRKAIAAGVPEKVAEANASVWGAAFRNLGRAIGMDPLNAFEALSEVRVFGPKSKAAPSETDVSFDFGANVEPPQRPLGLEETGVPAQQPLALEEAVAAIGRMAPANREAAQAFLEYTQGKRERPSITSDMERRLARFGVVDPQGYAFDESGRSLEHGLGGRKVFGAQPEDLRRYLETKRSEHPADEFYNPRDRLKQSPVKAEHPAVAEVRSAFERQPQETQLRAFYEEPVTGLLNERGFEALPTEGRPLVGHISVEGIKYRNDKAGHLQADELYRAVAEALHAEVPDAAKVGGDFAIRVKSNNEMKAILERVRARLPEEARGFALTGRTGDTLQAAGEANAAFKTAGEAKGTRALRGTRPLGLASDEAALATIPSKRVEGIDLPPALRERAAAMTPDELFSAVHLEKDTGLLTKAGFDARPPKKYRASIDLNGLKVLNREVSNAFGDLLLTTFGELARKEGGLEFDLAHDHGDEYLAQSDDQAALSAFLEKLTQRGEITEVMAGDEVGGIHTYKGVRFGYGIGEDAHSADAALNQHKQRLSEAGKRGDELTRLKYTPPGREADALVNKDWGRGGVDPAHDAGAAERGNRPSGGDGPAQGQKAGGVADELAPHSTAPGGAADALQGEPGGRSHLDAGNVRGRGARGGEAVRPEESGAAPGGGPEGEAGVTKLSQPAWHGTPHDFEKFSLRGIGTGEGNQVYGWGMYFAGNREVAEQYRRFLSEGREVLVDGKPWREIHAKLSRVESYIAGTMGALVSQTETRAKAFAAAKAELESQFKGKPEFAKELAELEKLDVSRFEVKETGKLYQTDIPENHELLDFDRSMSDQDPGVLAKLKAAGLIRFSGGAAFLPNGERVAPHGLTGEMLYSAIAEAKGGSPEAASKALDAAGIPGLRYLDAGSRDSGEGTHNYVVWNEERVRILQKLYQGPEGNFTLEKKGDRGYIQFSAPDGSGKPRRFDIHILEGADKSTFAHETMHFLSEVMGDAAQLPSASPALKADYQRMLDFMGHASHEERQAHAEERQALAALETRTPEEEKRLTALTAKEERVTHAWEAFLLEGKAPSAELARPFARFKRWLTDIYKGVQGIARTFRRQYGEDFRMTDDIRGVFERLLTSEDEVQKAEREAAREPFEVAKRAMTPGELAEYADASDRARDMAEAEVSRRIVEETRAENTAWLKGEEARIREGVEAELDQQPAYSALRALQEESPLGGEPLKLDRAALVRAYGPDFVRELPRGVFAKGKGGVSAEEAALRTGMEDGPALVKALRGLPPRDAVAARETKARMEAQYGPAILDNGPALADAAMNAVHSPAQARKVVLELNALRRLVKEGAPDVMSGDKAELLKTRAMAKEGEAQAAQEAAQAAGRQRALRAELLHGFDFSAAQAMAKRLVLEKTVMELRAGEQGLPGAYLRAERAAAKSALESAAKGDMLGAIAWKERQLLNMALYREARDLREEMEKATQTLQGATTDASRAYLGKANPVYRDAHDAILQAVGLQAPAEGAAPLNLAALVAAADASAQDMDFDVEGLRALAANPRPWWSLKVDEARNVLDAVTNIRTAAREATTLQLEGKRVARETLLTEMEKAVSARPPQPLQPRDEARRGALADGRRVLQSLDAQLSTPETLVTMLDAHQPDGPFRRAILDAERQARDKERALKADFLPKVVDAFKRLPAELRARKSELVDVTRDLPMPADLKQTLAEGPVTRTYLWMVALNMGNAGNKQRLLDGYGWKEKQVMDVLNRELTKPEWDFVQSVWDTLEGLYPHIADVHEAATGLRPGKVVATKVTTPHGEYRGGYFPAREDSRVKRTPIRQNPENVADMFGEEYRRPSVVTGHAKARAVKADYVVNLGWSVVPSHLAQVIHDVSYRPFVRQTAQLFLDKRFVDLTQRYLGAERAKQFVPWLQAVANNQAESVPGHLQGAQRVLGWIRGRAARQVMGGNLASMSKHFLDPLNALVAGLAHPGDVAMAQVRATNPVTWKPMRDFAAQASSELQARQDHLTREVQRELKEIGDVKPNAALAARNSLARGAEHVLGSLHEWMDRYVTTITWTAAYTQAQREAQKGGFSPEDAHTDAVKAADDMVRKVYPSPEVGQMAAALRNKSFLGTSLMFAGFANKTWNLKRQAMDRMFLDWADADSGKGDKALAAAKFTGKLMAFAALGVGVKFLGGQGKKDDEEQADFAARTMLADPFVDTPVLGTLAEHLSEYAVSGQRKPLNLRTSVAGDFVSQVWDAATKSHADETDDQRLQRYVENLLTLGLAGSGGGQVHKTLDYARQLESGEAQPRGPLDVAAGLVYGKRDKQGQNPLGAAQDVLSE